MNQMTGIKLINNELQTQIEMGNKKIKTFQRTCQQKLRLQSQQETNSSIDRLDNDFESTVGLCCYFAILIELVLFLHNK